AAHKCAVFDHGHVFRGAVKITGNGARADVDLLTDFGVAQIGEMVGFGAAAQPGLFGLHKVAHVYAFANLTAGAQMRVRANQRTGRNSRLINDATGPDQHVVRNLRVADDAEGAYTAVRTDLGPAKNLHERLKNGVRADL